MKNLKSKIDKNLKPKTCNLKTNKGFTLIEVLVAVTILTVGVTASVGAIVNSTKLAPEVKKRLIAAQLAQEGIELVRNIRDINWIDGNVWDFGITDDLSTGQSKVGCIQYNDSVFDVNCSSLSSGYSIKLSDGYYVHNTAGAGSVANTDFTRTITLQKTSVDSITVQSDVICGVNCDISVKGYLFNWK